MTGKRFSHNGVVIIDHLKKDLIYINGKEDLLELAEYVDKLQEENEQLQIEKDTLKKQHTYELTKKLEYKSKLTDLKKENKQLKSHVDDITVAVEVETCKLMDNIINLIDKKITEINQEYDPYARQGKVLDMSNRQFAISILNELKKELKE